MHWSSALVYLNTLQLQRAPAGWQAALRLCGWVDGLCVSVTWPLAPVLNAQLQANRGSSCCSSVGVCQSELLACHLGVRHGLPSMADLHPSGLHSMSWKW